MKKLYLSIFTVLFLVTYSQAQFFSAGLKAGGQSCAVALSPSGNLDISGIFGYHAGAFAKIKSPVKFGGKIEVLYSARGGDITSPAQTITIPGGGTITSEESTTEFRASYIDIPLMATFNIIKPLAIEAGPQFSFLANGELSGGGQSVDWEPDNSPEIGFAVGLDFSLPKKLGVYARYNMGFNSETVSETVQGVTVESKTDYTQSWVQFGVRYSLVQPL